MIGNLSSILMRAPLQSLKQAYSFGDEISGYFQEGLYLSSETLWKEMQKRDSLSEKEKSKLQLSFSKYHIRSCSRCTPYGTFAGSAVVAINDEDTELTVNAPENHVKKIRIDMNYMTEIIYALIKIPEVKNAIKFFANNSIYQFGNSYRYVQFVIRNNTRYYELTSVEKSDYLALLLKAAGNGATINSLALILTENEDVTYDEAVAFVSDLYDSQLLISELEPSVTGNDPLDNLVLQLEALNVAPEVLGQLHKIKQIIDEPGNGVAYYQQIQAELKKLNIEVAIPDNTIQTDLYLSLQDSTINSAVVQKIIEQHEDLSVFAKKIRNPALDDFRKKFLQKYEGEEIPLALALDVELGIGYAGNDQSAAGVNFLINDINASYGSGQQMHEFDNLQRYVQSKYHDYLHQKAEFIEITESELALLKTKQQHTFPNSFYLFGSLFKTAEQIDQDNFSFFLNGSAGPSGGNLLARFTHGSEDIFKLTRLALQQEEDENPDVLFAEIAHLPQARVGNVLLRPVLRKFEIPYVGKSGADVNDQIPLSDIMVRVQDGQVILRSLKHNKRIIPRLTTAHNYVNMALPVYRFLGDIQFQSFSHNNFWDWGTLSAMPSLPRVIYKNLILQKAQWKIEYKTLTDLPADKSEYITYFREFIQKNKLPTQVLYIEGDNKLLINFEYLQGIELFLHYLKKRKSILVEEFLFTEENCVVKNTSGDPFTNEFIIPLHRKTETPIESIKQLNTSYKVKRKFALSSEWVYFKIYCGPAIAEKLLKSEILNFVEEGLDNNLFEKFFFLRFSDDSWHIRIRFYNTDVSKNLVIQQRLMQVLQPFLNSNVIEKVLLDTYVRELERYGEELIEEAEGVFCFDSLAVLRFISLLESEEFEKYRVIFALRGIDELLNDFKLSVNEKKELLKSIASRFINEFGGQAALEKQLNDKYRAQQKEIFAHMNRDLDIQNEIDEAAQIFRARSEMNKPIVARIMQTLNQSAEKRDELLNSYIHMFINRLFISNQRKYELVVTHFLERYYTSLSAIEKKKVLVG